jgi:hypothetical protein
VAKWCAVGAHATVLAQKYDVDCRANIAVPNIAAPALEYCVEESNTV